MRIVIFDPQQIVAEFLAHCCLENHHTIAAIAVTGCSALAAISHFKPELVVAEPFAPDMDGFEIPRLTRQITPTAKLLIVSSRLDDYALAQTEQLRAEGFVDKTTEGIRNLASALVAIAGGGRFFSPSFMDAHWRRITNPKSWYRLLSTQEQRILAHIAAGHDNDEIASSLAITSHTVRTHRKNISRKLAIENGVKLALFAVRCGLPTPAADSRLNGGRLSTGESKVQNWQTLRHPDSAR